MITANLHNPERPGCAQRDRVAGPPRIDPGSVCRRIGGGAVRLLELEVHLSSVSGTGGLGPDGASSLAVDTKPDFVDTERDRL
jgi:hypothetical protein